MHADLTHHIQTEILLHGEQLKLLIKAATVAVLLYIGVADLRTFKIHNGSVLLLATLYLLYALIARSWQEILSSAILAAAAFGVVLLFYMRGAIGGGDVKLLPVAYLWVGAPCALIFSALLFGLVVLHLCIIKLRWASTKTIQGRVAIPYAPSVVGAMIGVIALGCL
jgi:prepilin peptidase CpaA